MQARNNVSYILGFVPDIDYRGRRRHTVQEDKLAEISIAGNQNATFQGRMSEHSFIIRCSEQQDCFHDVVARRQKGARDRPADIRIAQKLQAARA